MGFLDGVAHVIGALFGAAKSGMNDLSEASKNAQSKEDRELFNDLNSSKFAVKGAAFGELKKRGYSEDELKSKMRS